MDDILASDLANKHNSKYSSSDEREESKQSALPHYCKDGLVLNAPLLPPNLADIVSSLRDAPRYRFDKEFPHQRNFAVGDLPLPVFVLSVFSSEERRESAKRFVVLPFSSRPLTFHERIHGFNSSVFSMQFIGGGWTQACDLGVGCGNKVRETRA